VVLASCNPSQLVANLTHYLDGFSDHVREIIEKFDLSNQIRKMPEANALFGVIEKFVSSEINLSPNDITAPDGKKLPGLSNLGMGYVFEELMKKPTKPSLPENPAAESLAQRIGERLRRARLMSGHSLRSLAEGIQGVVAHTMLQKYESGEACPDTQVLARLAQTLNLRPDYFSKNSGITLQTVEYRSQTRLGAKARQRLEERAFEFFEPYLEIESILNLPSSAFLQADLSALKADQLGDAIEAAADKLRIPPHEEGFEGFSAFASGYGLRLPVIALTERRLRGTEAGLLEN
jgi:transcriptional regulator with XRE-family HTH domain